MLDSEELRFLEFEKKTWHFRGSKESAIRDGFGLTPYRYYQRLNRIIDQPAAEAAEPELVHRLRRLRDELIARKRVGKG